MKDSYDLPLTTAAAAGDAYNRALKAFAGFDADLPEHAQAALQADPEFVAAHCLWGYFMMLAYSRATVPAAAEALRAAQRHARHATPREQAHVRALERWIGGDLDGALREWELILVVWPRDLLAVRLLHANYFWRGRQAEMRASLERVAGHWRDDAGFMACLAFALEETGDYAAAERLGRRAIELDPTEVWGAHAVAHVLEMQRRPAEGIAWLAGLEQHWAGKGLFLHHLWWHRAMFHLAGRQFDAVLDLYDRRFRNLASPLTAAMPDFHVDVQNAASMLMRLELRGVAVGARWEELADKAEAHIGDGLSAWTLPHWMMALAAGGRDRAARSMLDFLKDNRDSTLREVAAPVCEAVLAHRRGAHERVVALMQPLLHRVIELGGSHAQRDVLAQVFADSARKTELAVL
jgi:tetratricopeptide (TPR) repeat protein